MAQITGQYLYRVHHAVKYYMADGRRKHFSSAGLFLHLRNPLIFARHWVQYSWPTSRVYCPDTKRMRTDWPVKAQTLLSAASRLPRKSPDRGSQVVGNTWKGFSSPVVRRGPCLLVSTLFRVSHDPLPAHQVSDARDVSRKGNDDAVLETFRDGNQTALPDPSPA